MKPDVKTLLSKPVLEATPLLLGWVLCRRTPEGVVKLRLVETEAYHHDDPASHSFKWKTERTAPMFEAGGTIYVYFTYGMHYAINIVTGKKGIGEAVLLRAGEPLEGIEIMRRNRSVTSIHQLASGPGKLAQALGISDTKLSDRKLSENTLWLESPGAPVRRSQIVTGPRIGIRQAIDNPWRFYLKNNPFVSR